METEGENYLDEDDKALPVLKAEVERTIKEMKKKKAVGNVDISVD